jgi:stage III sporulation protein AB
LKWLGLLAVVISGTLCGLAAMRRTHHRLSVTRTVIRWLREFERRLEYTAPPVREWLRETSAAPSYEALEFIGETLRRMRDEDLRTAWTEAVRVKPCGLGAEELALLQAYGQHLGTGDVNTQLQCVRETVTALEKRVKSLEDRLSSISEDTKANLNNSNE